jgi:hypothetical protein
LIHQPVYSFFVKKATKLTARTVFYDSVLFGLLIYLYPVVVILLAVILGVFAGWVASWIGIILCLGGGALSVSLAFVGLGWGADYR